ncbi:MAG: helicase-exonuclease AddAB subunit AddA [Candidatus Gastranaerophilales bacterium]|nr:helicase-exonuclease AddAB subunit AddA [Candidatus Gastranaerophilales bacterium]
MSIQYTPEQQKVIELHNRNILVSAAAGSGKTAVLVERIVRMVCDEAHPVDVDRLLVVTFTNAAAAEMRERIAAGIAEQLRQHPESEHIQKQSTLLHNAQITTIDSFSLFLVRNHFNEIGLDPAFRVADEGEIRLMQQDVLSGLLEDAFARKEDDFLACVEHFCPGGKEKVLEGHILDLSRYAASFPWPEEWLEARREDYAADCEKALLQSDYGVYLWEHVARMLAGCVEKMERVKKLCETPDGPYMYGELVEQEAEQLRRLAECANLEECAARALTVSFGRLPSKKDTSVSAQKRELAKKMRGEVKDTVQEMVEKFFATPLELAAAQGRACMAPVSALIDLVLEFDRRMKAKKQEKKVIDFSDMEHYALEILLDRENGEIHPSPVALEYRQYFKEILIDEYQDSNLVQEYLLKAVSGEEDGRYNRFMVGDVKQSIYKFRLANPQLFLEKYETYTDDGERQRIDLSKNFRSRVQVVDTVNGIFSRIMDKNIGEIDYDDRAALYVGAVYPENADCESELLIVEKPETEERINAKQAEILVIAEKIKELRASFQVTDKDSGELRPAAYRDMVILLRSPSGWDEACKEVLEAEGIPAYITSKTGYFAASEVQELLQLLRVLDNPRQDIPLFGVLRSIFGGFTEEEIALMRAHKKEGTLYEALCAYSEETPLEETKTPSEERDPALMRKVHRFLEQISAYRDVAVYLPIRSLLQRIVDDYDYLDYVTALPAGGKRRANVEMLFTKASDFEKTSYFGLFHFVRYMEQLEKYDMDYGEAELLDENADVVRIMSIHKSKGLEFPVAFVAGLSKRFNMQSVNQSLIVDMDLGLACDYVDPVKRIRNKTLRRLAVSRKMRADSLAEELRVLYVALTRAKEKLIMTASLEQAADKWEVWKEQAADHLSYIDFMEAGSFLDFLLPILAQTNVKVSTISSEDLIGTKLTGQVGLYEKRSRLEKSDLYVDEEMLAKLRERFAYAYPHRNLEKLYTKTTVSELKLAAMADKDEEAYHAFEEKEMVPYIPVFRREEEKVSGAVRGNAYHRAMELLELPLLLDGQFSQFPADYESYRAGLDRGRLAADLDAFLEREVAALRLSQEYFAALSRRKLLHFLEQEIAYRMWAADRKGQLYREQPFVLGIEARRLAAEFPAGEKVLIQGIIDVFFIEEGALVLLDYKTDVVASMEALWNRYAVQLAYYEEALTNLQQLPMKEKLLYSFHLGTT